MSYFVEVVSKTTLSQFITDTFGSLNHLLNVPVVDLGCLSYLL